MRLLLLTTAILTALTATQVNAESTLDRIKTSGKITIGYRENAEPISYTVDGKAMGYAIDVCSNVANEIKKTLNNPNIKVEYKIEHPMIRIPDLITGAIDLECGTSTHIKQRDEVVDFSTTYFITDVGVAVKKSSKINHLNELKGRPIVLTKGTTSEKFMTSLRRNDELDFKAVYGSDNKESAELLASDRMVGWAMDEVSLTTFIAKSKNPSDYKIIDGGLSKEPYGIMMAKDSPKLKAIADHVITNMWHSGEMSKLYKKWFQSPIPPSNINLNVQPSASFKDLEKNPTDKGIDL
ncbi:amino acid ABC transporter substrate-binding protein [Acinetobacter pollinis]|uniref:amino acid ABC transporter substrate-binding protein n=1 Tax=Acinetobacter pollinis TaxID=2605270 RepID=UPI0018A2A8BF|nr:amino acid ABC transporter substrate-binding protein [Acinetobacter pollinis]MBF7690316.1 amino acid ABC transporter substrate-binding protein [Acinetobacter pollinis]MBF7692857.1 amino acid ABC transporter substrate-binding protein [Acinetobacter pollinis]MBF7697828.1 amino acid ABC transporter substrate-binding protein [Acinetobacter pollinis]MBF7700564.1 amino acid ABC transporter substrate-binding protein [Acinetobacter pollinis]